MEIDRLTRIKNMRLDGHNLQAIADACGLCKQSISKILLQHPVEKPLTESDVARIIGCSRSRVDGLRKKGLIQPVRRGGRWIYNDEDVGRAVRVMQLVCAHCGRRLSLSCNAARKYCDACQKEYKRYSYWFIAEEARDKAHKASISWKRRHPEQAKAMEQRAREKYKDKLKIK